MVFDSRRCLTRRAAVMLFVLPLLVVLAVVSTVSAQLAPPVASPSPAEPTTLSPAWLQFGPDGRLIARVITEGECPALVIDGLDLDMTRRAAASDAFPVLSCEATVPFGTEMASILGQDLPLSAGPVRRIAVIGDTGCRVNDWEKKYQACNDPEAWPFAEVARAVADWDPDLIVHVGDYLYRESPCPDGMTGCQGNPHGDNWETWDADFFTPATLVLGAAPWLFMRGNHETCDRNPVGWFTFLDSRRYQPTCQRFTDPYVTTLHGVSFAVIDSAEAADTSDTPEEAAEYGRQFDLLAEITPPGSWLVTHRPVWGILDGKEGYFQVENAAYEAATKGSLKGDYGLVLSGHIHVAESLAFDEASERPPQLVSGNAGTALDQIPTGSPTAGELGDHAVTQAETLSAFGFMTLEPDEMGWTATQRDKRGNPLLDCMLVLDQMTCEASEPN